MALPAFWQPALCLTLKWCIVSLFFWGGGQIKCLLACLSENLCSPRMFLTTLQVLLGDRYGQTTLLRTIPASDYETLCDVAEVMQVRNGHLLRKLYEYDENAVPPIYVFRVRSCSQRLLVVFIARQHAAYACRARYCFTNSVCPSECPMPVLQVIE